MMTKNVLGFKILKALMKYIRETIQLIPPVFFGVGIGCHPKVN